MNQPDPTLVSAILTWLMLAVPQVLAALALVVGGAWLSRVCERALLRIMDRQLAGDLTLRGVLGSSIRYAILLLFLLAAIGQLGFQMSSVLAVLATAGLAVGLALQATLSNIAAGIMLLWLRPFKVGDNIEVGAVAGKVFEVGLFASEIHTIDGLYQFVPNSEIWNKRLTNFSRLPKRLVSIRVKLTNASSIEHLRDWVAQELTTDPRILTDPKPALVVSELADDKIIVAIQAWTSTDNFAAVLRDISDRIPALIAQHPRID